MCVKFLEWFAKGLQYRERDLPSAFTVFRTWPYDTSCDSLNHHIARLNEPSNDPNVVLIIYSTTRIQFVTGDNTASVVSISQRQ